MNPTAAAANGQSQGWLYNCVGNFFPFVTPAVSNDGYNVDQFLIRFRSVVVGVAIAALCSPRRISPITPLFRIIESIPYLAFSSILITTVYALAIIIPVVILRAVENQRATQIVDRNCVNAFIEQTPVPEQAMNHIRNSMTAAQMLVADPRHVDLNKDDSRRVPHPLIDRPDMNFEVFKLLSNGLESSRYDFSQGRLASHCGFYYAVSSSHPRYLSYLIDNNLMPDRSQLSPDVQVYCWKDIGHADTIPMLINAGFDINVMNSQGRTALYELTLGVEADLPELPLLAEGALSRQQRIDLLRQHGARSENHNLD